MNPVDFIKELSIKVKAGQGQAAYIMPGRWSERGYKKLLGVKGEQIAEYENCVLCSFPAKELLQAAMKSLPRMTLKMSGTVEAGEGVEEEAIAAWNRRKPAE